MMAPRLAANPEAEAGSGKLKAKPEMEALGRSRLACDPYYNGVSITRPCYLCNIGPKTSV